VTDLGDELVGSPATRCRAGSSGGEIAYVRHVILEGEILHLHSLLELKVQGVEDEYVAGSDRAFAAGGMRQACASSVRLSRERPVSPRAQCLIGSS